MESGICPVDVIAMHSANGDIRPLRLRLEDEAHGLLRIDIDEVVSSKPVQFVGIEARIFLCKAVVRDKLWIWHSVSFSMWMQTAHFYLGLRLIG